MIDIGKHNSLIQTLSGKIQYVPHLFGVAISILCLLYIYILSERPKSDGKYNV